MKSSTTPRVHPINAALCKIGIHWYAADAHPKVTKKTVSVHYDCTHCPKQKISTFWRVQVDTGTKLTKRTQAAPHRRLAGAHI